MALQAHSSQCGCGIGAKVTQDPEKFRGSTVQEDGQVETQLSLQDKLDIYSKLLQATSMLDMSTKNKNDKIIKICRHLYELLDNPQK